jgi:hypothetical protein
LEDRQEKTEENATEDHQIERYVRLDFIGRLAFAVERVNHWA